MQKIVMRLVFLAFAILVSSCSVSSPHSNADIKDLRERQTVLKQEIDKHWAALSLWHDAQEDAARKLAKDSGIDCDVSGTSPYASCKILRKQCQSVKSLHKKLTALKNELKDITDVIEERADRAQ